MTKTTEAILVTQWSTFLWSLAGILVMLTIALRSPMLAALALVPTLLAVGLVLGLMGWLGIKLDMATALVASVALGLSVDDTFHCLLQFRRERQERTFRQSLFDSYAVTGPGVLLSSLAVAVGFAALAVQRVHPVRVLRHDGLHRHGRQHAGQPDPASCLPDAGRAASQPTGSQGQASHGGRVAVRVSCVASPIVTPRGEASGSPG